MKRVIIALIAVFMVFTACCLAEEITEAAPETKTMYVTGCGSLSIYAAPDYSSKKLDVVGSTEAVEVTEIIEGMPYSFAAVSYKKLGKTITGYANAAYLTSAEPEALELPGIVLPDLYLRTEPNLKAPKIVLMPSQSKLIIHRFVGHWAYVTVHINGKAYKGYCYHEFSNVCFNIGSSMRRPSAPEIYE